MKSEHCVDSQLPGQASPLDIRRWPLASSLSSLSIQLLSPESTHPHSQVKEGLASPGHLCPAKEIPTAQHQTRTPQSSQALQGWASPPSSASWTQVSEGLPFSRPRSAVQVKCLGSDQQTLALLCCWPRLSQENSFTTRLRQGKTAPRTGTDRECCSVTLHTGGCRVQKGPS